MIIKRFFPIIVEDNNISKYLMQIESRRLCLGGNLATCAA
jgi:hypothetical protein